MITDYGTLDIGPYDVRIRLNEETWEFVPIYNSRMPLHMQYLYAQIGDVWTKVPDDEVWKVKQTLGIE